MGAAVTTPLRPFEYLVPPGIRGKPEGDVYYALTMAGRSGGRIRATGPQSRGLCQVLENDGLLRFLSADALLPGVEPVLWYGLTVQGQQWLADQQAKAIAAERKG